MSPKPACPPIAGDPLPVARICKRPSNRPHPWLQPGFSADKPPVLRRDGQRALMSNNRNLWLHQSAARLHIDHAQVPLLPTCTVVVKSLNLPASTSPKSTCPLPAGGLSLPGQIGAMQSLIFWQQMPSNSLICIAVSKRMHQAVGISL